MLSKSPQLLYNLENRVDIYKKLKDNNPVYRDVTRSTSLTLAQIPKGVGDRHQGPFVSLPYTRPEGPDNLSPNHRSEMIVGKKTRLRPIEREDIPRFVEWFSDPDVRQHLDQYLPVSVSQEEHWFEEMLNRMRKRQDFVFAIETMDGEHIGNIGLHKINWKDRHAEMGIVIGEKDKWGQGYGTDALRTLLGLVFDEMNLHRVYLRVNVDNDRAIRCYEKVGFRHEGTLRETAFREGAYHDRHIMGILRTEFDKGDEKAGNE